MHVHDHNVLVCSVCGFSDYEFFQDLVKKGIRCRHCGHEKAESIDPPAETKNFGYCWEYEWKKPEKF